MRNKDRYYPATDMQKNHIDEVLMDDETILWRQKPKRAAYIFSAVAKNLPIVLLWITVDTAFMATLFLFVKMSVVAYVLVSVFFAIHLLPVWFWISGIFYSIAEAKNVEYALTDRRVLVRSGVVGIDFKSIFYTQIQGVNTRVNLIDKAFKVGDVYINATSQAAVLYDISDPYGIGAKLQKIIVDIATDVEFPNAYRPEENPGYRTKYTASPFDRNKHRGEKP